MYLLLENGSRLLLEDGISGILLDIFVSIPGSNSWVIRRRR